jgi:CHASE3 domain sensor protein
MISGIWAKITAGLTFVLFCCLLAVKMLLWRNRALSDSNKKLKKAVALEKDAALIRAEIAAQEQEQVLKMAKQVQANDKKITVDDINNL